MNVYLTSPWIPAEWVRAHGLEPRGIGSAAHFSRGNLPLSAGVCTFAEAAVWFAEAQTDSAVVFSTACDQMRRGFDMATLHHRPRSFLFNLSATWQSAAAKEIFRAELGRFGEFLTGIGGRAPSPEKLRQEMVAAGSVRKHLLASAPGSSAGAFAQAVAQFYWDGTFSPLPQATPGDEIPLALVGGPFPAAHWKLLDEIEAAGGRVVLNATETGERSLTPEFEFEGTTDNSFDALVSGYCNHLVDVFQRPNTRLYDWLKPRLASRQARGIVLWHFTGCDLWRAEAQTLRENFGLPVLLLEAGGEPGNAPRGLTRLHAFVETLK